MSTTRTPTTGGMTRGMPLTATMEEANPLPEPQH